MDHRVIATLPVVKRVNLRLQESAPAAVASLLGLDRPMPEAPLLFREGLLASPERDDHLLLAADRLDFNYVWTTWRGPRRRWRS